MDAGMKLGGMKLRMLSTKVGQIYRTLPLVAAGFLIIGLTAQKLDAQPVSDDLIAPPEVSAPEPAPNPNKDAELNQQGGIDPELGPIQEPDNGDIEPALRTTDGSSWETGDQEIRDKIRKEAEAEANKGKQANTLTGIMPHLEGANIPNIPISLLFPNGDATGTNSVGPVIRREIAGTSVLITGLNRETGTKLRFRVSIGNTVRFEQLNVKVSACYKSHPEDSNESYAYVEVVDNGRPIVAPLAVLPQRDRVKQREAQAARILRRGWIIASSPTVTPIDHPVYDMWLDGCEGGAINQVVAQIDATKSVPKAR